MAQSDRYFAGGLALTLLFSLAQCSAGQWHISCRHCWCRNVSITCEVDDVDAALEAPTSEITNRTTSM